MCRRMIARRSTRTFKSRRTVIVSMGLFELLIVAVGRSEEYCARGHTQLVSKT